MRAAPHVLFWATLVGALILQLVGLPQIVAAARPLWVPLVLAYWCLRDPRVPAFLGALLAGLALDVLFATPLGQHGLGLVLIVFLVARLRSLFGLFPMWQAMLALVPIWALYSVLMFWLDGIFRHDTDSVLRWMPILSTYLFWPVVYAVLEALRLHQPASD